MPLLRRACVRPHTSPRTPPGPASARRAAWPCRPGPIIVAGLSISSMSISSTSVLDAGERLVDGRAQRVIALREDVHRAQEIGLSALRRGDLPQEMLLRRLRLGGRERPAPPAARACQPAELVVRSASSRLPERRTTWSTTLSSLMSAFVAGLQGALVMGPMTKGSNLPYRRLCVELGARVTMSEMTVARRLKQRRKGEFALIRRFDGEPFFGVQLAGTNPEEMGWAAALGESRGADLVDLNCGCPIDHFTHKGIGASLGRQPNRQRRIIETMKKRGEGATPVTAKIRLGWNDDDAERAGPGQGRRRRWRRCASPSTDGRATRATGPRRTGTPSAPSRRRSDSRHRQRRRAVRTRRRAAARPRRLHWRDDRAGGLDPPVAVPRSDRRDIATCRRSTPRHLPPLRHAGEGTLGERRSRAGPRAQFTRWHLDFWCRDVGVTTMARSRRCRCASGSGAGAHTARCAARAVPTPPRHDYVAECLVMEREIVPAEAPPAGAEQESPGAGSRRLAMPAPGHGSRPRRLPALQLLERTRPVVFQQPRQPPIGQQAAARLAGGTVVRFVATRT